MRSFFAFRVPLVDCEKSWQLTLRLDVVTLPAAAAAVDGTFEEPVGEVAQRYQADLAGGTCAGVTRHLRTCSRCAARGRRRRRKRGRRGRPPTGHLRRKKGTRRIIKR